MSNFSPRSTSGLRGLSIISAAAFCITQSASAVVLAEYRFPGTSAASADTDLLTTATNFSYGAFLNGDTTNNGIVSNILRVSQGAAGSTATNGDTLAEALANNAYVSFTLQTGGNSTNFGLLSFAYGLSNAANTVSQTMVVFSSATGFTAGDALGTYTYSNITGAASTDYSINLLSNPAFQNLTGDVEFRFYFYDGASGITRYHTLDNVVLDTVPEPSGAALMATGLAVAIFGRRRKS